MSERNLSRLVVTTVLLASCAGPRAPSKLALAATLPLSSRDESQVAAAWERGYRRAVDELNASGGVLLARLGTRLRVTLQVRDDAGDLPRAEQAAEQLLAAGAHVLLATPGAVHMAVQAAVAERHQRPYAVPASAGPDLRATPHAWLLVAPASGATDEEAAYQTARAALDAVARAGAWEGEALRRALVTPPVGPAER